MKLVYFCKIRVFHFFALILMAITVSGCGNRIDSVKGGKLNDHPQTTIGNAFEAFFQSPSWTLIEAANKTKYVNFVGKTKSHIPFIGENVVIPAGSNVEIQFTLLDNDKFQINTMQGTIGFRPGITEGQLFIALLISGAAEVLGPDIKATRKLSFTREVQTELLKVIYDNNLPLTPTPTPTPAPAAAPTPVAAASALAPASTPVVAAVAVAPPPTLAVSAPAVIAPAPAPTPEPAPAPKVDTSAFAPSFDCAKAGTGPERLICSDRELSKLDVDLSQAYSKAREKSADKNKLKSEQLEWFKRSRNACSDKSCMETAYKQRISDLAK